MARKIKIVQRYRDAAGQTKVKGGPHLRETQSYPHGLGLQACMFFLKFLHADCTSIFLHAGVCAVERKFAQALVPPHPPGPKVLGRLPAFSEKSLNCALLEVVVSQASRMDDSP